MSSNADETAEIILGGKIFQVKAPTLDQLQELGDAFAAIPMPSLGKKLPAIARIIEVLSGEKVEGSLQVTFLEIDDAVDTLMKVTGLEAVGEKARRRQEARAAGAKS